MIDMKQIYEFAVKWYNKFNDENINYVELVEHCLGDDCKEIGFEMDCGQSFRKEYGDAISESDALKRIIDDIKDIKLLGSAIYSQWRYFNHWAYSGAEILEAKNREWFILALGRLQQLVSEYPLRFHGQPKKIRIISNNICYGPMPEPDDEVEQRITINNEGRVWFSAYNFGEVPGKYTKARSKVYKIEKLLANRVLERIATYFNSEYEDDFITDSGCWTIEITNTKGKVYVFDGPLYTEVMLDNDNISELVREALDMSDLYVFDGNIKE